MSTTAEAQLQAENRALKAQLAANERKLVSQDNELANQASALASQTNELANQEAALAEQLRKVQSLMLKIAKYEEERRLDRARRFGASSEAGDHQYRLFNESEVQAEDEETATHHETIDGEAIVVAAHTKRRGKRLPLPKDLPRVVITHKADDTTCACGHEMHVIDEKVSEQLDIVPAQVYVIEHRRPTLSCWRCDESIRTVPMPPQPIPKRVASPGLLAHVAIAKYADGLPLYRQTKQWKRLDVDLPRNTLASHMIKIGVLVQPLIDALRSHVLAYDIVQMDETTVQVLKEPDKLARSKSYMWVMRGGPPDELAVLYHYATSRAKTVPERLLAGFAGHLQTDGYAGYNGVVAKEGITGLGCWAHARRKFIEAQKALPKAQQNKGNKVTQALAFIGKLYQLERAIAQKTPDEKKAAREQKARPALEQLHAWLDKQSVPPLSLLGKAISYTLGQWPRLIVYLDDGRLNIDNNAAENAIRPFVVGRKNWLFSDTQRGADASANLYSLIETAKANQINDYAYLKFVLTTLPALRAGDINSLLPWNVTAEQLEQQLQPIN